MLMPEPPALEPGCAQPCTGCCTVTPACTQYVQAILAGTL